MRQRIPSFSEAGWNSLSNDEQSELLEEMGSALHLHINLQIRWVMELVELTNALSSGPVDGAHVHLFYLRLWGLLSELAPAPTGTPPSEHMKPMWDIVQEIFARWTDLRDTLTQDELLFVEYQRVVAAHPWLDSYFLRVGGTADAPLLQRRRKNGRTGEPVSLVNIRESISRVAQLGDEMAVATALAARLSGPTRRYLEAITKEYPVRDLIGRTT